MLIEQLRLCVRPIEFNSALNAFTAEYTRNLWQSVALLFLLPRTQTHVVRINCRWDCRVVRQAEIEKEVTSKWKQKQILSLARPSRCCASQRSWCSSCAGPMQGWCWCLVNPTRYPVTACRWVRELGRRTRSLHDSTNDWVAQLRSIARPWTILDEAQNSNSSAGGRRRSTKRNLKSSVPSSVGRVLSTTLTSLRGKLSQSVS